MARTAPVPNIPAPPGMNPGAFVAGGGGDGGGAGGKGGKNGNGEEGAGTGDGDEEANGDGNCAGAGSCSNCGHSAAAGDPVDVLTGEVFTLPAQDLFLPGRFNFAFRRSYSSGRRDLDVGLGHGWCHSLGWRLREQRKLLTLITGDGRTLVLPNAAGEGQIVAVGRYKVLRGRGLYVVYPGTEFAHIFKELVPGSGDFRLFWVRYRNRGQISIEYKKGAIESATDSVGRRIDFSSDAEGRIRRISVGNGGTQTLVFGRYGYDSAGNLVSATNANGHTTQFEYGTDHELRRITYPNRVGFHFVYDQTYRCIETWGTTPASPDPALLPDLPDLLADGVTTRKGIHHCRLDFIDAETTSVAEAHRIRRFVETDGKVGLSVGGNGNVTSRVFDQDRNCLSQVDATGAEWRWEYDGEGNIVKTIDPTEAVTLVERNLLGQEVRITDQEGAVTEFERDHSGEVTRVRLPSGADLQYTLDDYGSPLSAQDARGGIHRFQLDQHANRVSHEFPGGAVYRFEFDYWGRMTREVDPHGNAKSFTYAPDGKLTSITDPLGRTRHFSYDEMGNLTQDLYPDGTSHRYEYGGFNWLYRSIWPDGSEVRGGYDSDGRMCQLTNEAGQTWRYRYDAEGCLISDTDFAGRRRSFDHDPLGRLIAVETNEGRTVYERDPRGLITQIVNPQDDAFAFSYNRRGQLTAVDDGVVQTELERDPNGWLIGERTRFEGFDSRVTTKRSQAGDRLELTTEHLARRELRDENGLVQELREDEHLTLALSRDVSGRLVERRYANAATLSDDWDAAGQLRYRTLRVPGGGASGNEPAWVGGQRSDVQRYFQYGNTGELKHTSSTRGETRNARYDGRHRLVEYERDGQLEAFSYSPSSNPYPSGENAESRAYDSADRLLQRGAVSYVYDDQGRLVEERDYHTQKLIRSFSWDSWGRLRSVNRTGDSRVEFEYDPLYRRVAKRVVQRDQVVECHHYVWDKAALIEDRCVTGEGPSIAYLYADEHDAIPIAHRDLVSHHWLHYFSDNNGFPEHLIDGTGGIVGTLRATAFRAATDKSSEPTLLRAPGQFADTETGLHYNRCRYYDPESGRYISPDPIGILGPGGLNLYMYCPNPINWSDPAGLDHALTVTGSGVANMTQPALSRSSPSSGSLAYYAGRGGPAGANPPLPGGNTHDLWPTAAYHSEQRFSHDLITQARANPGRFGPGPNGVRQEFNLGGSLPPCPACHASMMRAAEESGANIHYTWGNPPNTMTYAGGSGTPSATTGNATDLLNNYGHTPIAWDTSTATPNPNLAYGTGAGAVNRPTQAWGYSIPPSAWTEYNRQKVL